jgi:predicted amidohydrolase YtcJ
LSSARLPSSTLEPSSLLPGSPAFADRVEHASIVPAGYADELARLKIAVVTQPGFIAERGDAYLAHVPAPELDWLYPCVSLLQARGSGRCEH